LRTPLAVCIGSVHEISLPHYNMREHWARSSSSCYLNNTI